MRRGRHSSKHVHRLRKKLARAIKHAHRHSKHRPGRHTAATKRWRKARTHKRRHDAFSKHRPGRHSAATRRWRKARSHKSRHSRHRGRGRKR